MEETKHALGEFYLRDGSRILARYSSTPKSVDLYNPLILHEDIVETEFGNHTSLVLDRYMIFGSNDIITINVDDILACTGVPVHNERYYDLSVELIEEKERANRENISHMCDHMQEYIQKLREEKKDDEIAKVVKEANQSTDGEQKENKVIQLTRPSVSQTWRTKDL